MQEYFAAWVLAQQAELERLIVPWRSTELAEVSTEALLAQGGDDDLPELPTSGWEETALNAASLSDKSDAFIRMLMPANLALAGRCAAQPGLRVSDALRNELQTALIYSLLKQGAIATIAATRGTLGGDFEPEHSYFTPIGGGLEMAYDQLNDPEDEEGFYANRTVVLLSDGKHNCGPDPTDNSEPFAAREEDQDIVVHAVGLGEDSIDPEAIRGIASANDGDYRNSPNPRDIPSYYRVKMAKKVQLVNYRMEQSTAESRIIHIERSIQETLHQSR